MKPASFSLYTAWQPDRVKQKAREGQAGEGQAGTGATDHRNN